MTADNVTILHHMFFRRTITIIASEIILYYILS